MCFLKCNCLRDLVSAAGGLLGVPSLPLTEGGCVGARRGIGVVRAPKDSVYLYEGGFQGRGGISGDVCVLGSGVGVSMCSQIIRCVGVFVIRDRDGGKVVDWTICRGGCWVTAALCS